MRKIYLLVGFIFTCNFLFAQTPVPMNTQPGLTYTENFTDIANWTNGFAAGIGANRFGSVAINATGTIPDGVRITTATTNFATGTSGGVQRGTGNIVLLSTGATDNTSSAAIDFFMDFTGVNAGSLSFDWASVNNSTGDRKGSLRVYYSVDGSTFTELTTAQVLNFTNNSLTSGSISTVALPATFNNNATARLRFYYSNGTGGAAGSRPKISIDNLTVSATPAGGNIVSVSAGTNAAEPAANGTFTIDFSSPTSDETNIDFNFGGTASFGTDYTVSYSAGNTVSTTNTGTLIVPAGTSSVTVTITPADDIDVEPAETISLTLSSPTDGYTLGNASAAINLTDNDVAPTVSVAAGVNAAEPATNGTFTITLSSVAPASGVTINYTLSGTAALNSDYTDPQSGSITITEGNTTGTITLNVSDDPDAEPVETIIITLDNVSSPYTINVGSATINLTSDDFTPISLTGVYSQNFDALANTGINNVLTIPGWLLNETGGGARDNEQYATDNGGSGTGDTYSYGATASTERALGALQSGTLISTFGSAYINNTGTTISKLRITYTGEQWRLGATGRNDRLEFQYSTDATNLITGSWIDINQLDFVAPNSTGSVGALIGNDLANKITISFDITGLTIPNGANFIIRWNDGNASGADDGLAIDDFSIEANPLDLVAPVILTLSPANTATNVSLTSDATITFDEPVQKVGGNIVLKRTSDNSIVQTISVNSTDVNVSSASVSINLSQLNANTSYYIEIDNGAFEDLSGNDFAGFNGNSTWSFTTGTDFYTANFNTCTSTLTDGFTQYSVTGSVVWGCTTFGRDPAAPSGTTPFPNGIQINGFTGGTNVPNVDWFISPSFDFTGTTFPLLSFWSRTAFNGLPLQLKVSTDYTGGDPALATWADINGKFPNQATNIWTLSENINLSAFKQSNVHFAFVYTSTDDDGARWTLDDISVINSPIPPPPSLTVGTTDIQYTFVANGTTADKTFVFTGNDLTGDITLTATGNFLLSKNGSGFSSSLSYTQAEANNITQTVFVRFAPSQANQNFNGTILISTSDLSATINLKGTSIDPTTTLEVVNWNIEWFGSTLEGPSNEAQQEQNVKTILNNTGADIYGFVEVVDEARLAALVSQMPGYSYKISNYGSHTNTAANPPGALAQAQKLAFVYKTGMFSNVTAEPLLSVGINSAADLTNPNYNYWASGRFPYMLSADVTLNCVTKHMKFILIHAKANTSPTNVSYERRKNGADALYNLLNQTYSSDNIIMLGDFNDDFDQSITAGFTTTSWDAFTTDAANYQALTLPLSLAGKKSTVSFNDVIDHVVVSSELAPYYMTETANILNDVTSLVTNYGSTTSDHFPVFSRYRFEVPPAPVITCPANIEKNNDPGVCGATVVYEVIYSASCGTATLQQMEGLPSGSVFPVGTTTNTFIVTDTGGGTATCSFTVTVTDTENPTITCPANISVNSNGSSCGATVNYVVSFGDNCSGATIQQTDGLASGAVFPAGTTTNTFVVIDASGHTATCSFSVTVVDNVIPTFTRPADITILFTDACSYNAATTATGDVTNEQDNCSTGLQATFTDAVTTCGNTVTIKRTWKLTDNSSNKAADQIQTITVTDNNTKYVVYASKSVKFGEYNYINGSVGVTSTTGKAEFLKGSTLPAPYFVKAKTIQVSSQASVPNRIQIPANDGPNPPFFNFTGTTSGLSNRTISFTTSVPVSTNHKELKIKKNVKVTITGTLYGSIEIEEGAQVTFTPAGGILNIEKLEITGDNNATTQIKFGNCTSVRIKDKVEIDEHTLLNVNGPKVTFYLGDTNSDDELFIVNGSANIITANIYIKKGELRVTDDYNLLNGWFITERLVSDGKYVGWNDNNCNTTSNKGAENITIRDLEKIDQSSIDETETTLKVTASPNPSSDHFVLRIKSSDQNSVILRILDASGQTISAKPGISPNSTINVGNEWRGGVYFAEVIQGNKRAVVKLVKLN